MDKTELVALHNIKYYTWSKVSTDINDAINRVLFEVDNSSGKKDE